MRRSVYLSELRRAPWAMLPDVLPLAARVIARIERGLEPSAEDRREIEEGRTQWEARSQQSQAYAGEIAVIGVYGVLTQRGQAQDISTPTTSSSRLAGMVRAAAADPAIAGIVLDVDSPGGSVYGIEDLGNAIYQARSSKPVAAVANSVAASGAYWAASQADELYAAPGAEVGSIGVYCMHVDHSEAMKQEGLAVTFVSAGKYKVEAHPYAPLDDEARASAQASVDAYYDSFVKAVARGRSTSQKAVREGMGQGRMLLGDDAKAENMIDGTATLSEVVSKMQARVKRAAKTSALGRVQRETTIAELEG